MGDRTTASDHELLHSQRTMMKRLRQHPHGSGDPLPERFPITQEDLTLSALRPGDHLMILGNGTPIDAAAKRSTHAIVESLDPLRGYFVLVMDITNGSTAYKRQTALSLFQAVGVDPDVPADASRIKVIKSASGRLSTTEDIVERARAFLPTLTSPGPLPAIEGVWNQFAFGFFCQTGHLVSWDRFLVWYRNQSACI
ncbi:hypothetical protein pneo_cds_391 [Pandoravirus neocaledonia]|uniref:Uncharacterized protein n=1 Tax=Pandoravirus neocaledonia TaxID=2107708 RepID=A0A2U7UC06_9VIRU|nr:hypothetical protein pneo_cds_391 [Pandoravirus neocaledonia]AVK75998.1 hypothetical protein pneo_cds_391 [Pandoravirus neocaledonia]